MDINWSNLATDIQISVQTETDFKRYIIYGNCIICTMFILVYMQIREWANDSL